MPDITVTINLSHTYGGDDVRSAHLHIEDETSGTCLFDGRLTPEQFYTLHTSSQIKITGVSGHLDRVGKRMVMDSVKVPGYALAGVAYDQASTAAQKWADEAARRRGWDEVSVSRRQGGYFQATFRSWLDKYQTSPITDAVMPLVADVPEEELSSPLADDETQGRRVKVPALVGLERTREDARHATVAWATGWLERNGYTSFTPVAEVGGNITHVDFRK
jgi:hypothetical protein